MCERVEGRIFADEADKAPRVGRRRRAANDDGRARDDDDDGDGDGDAEDDDDARARGGGARDARGRRNDRGEG